MPTSRTEANTARKELAIQYRLRTDLVPAFIRLAERVKGTEASLEVLHAVHGQVLSIDLGQEDLSTKDFNRYQSFQIFLTQRLGELISLLEQKADPQMRAELESLKAMLQRQDQQILVARQKYILLARDHNQLMDSFPQNFYNWLVYKFTPLQNFDSSAAAN